MKTFGLFRFNKKSELRPFYSDLEETSLKIEEERKTESMRLKRDLEKLKSNVRSFRNTVLQLRPGGAVIFSIFQ